MAHPPCGTAQILLKRGCAATSLCCAPSAGDSQVARSRHHHSHWLWQWDDGASFGSPPPGSNENGGHEPRRSRRRTHLGVFQRHNLCSRPEHVENCSRFRPPFTRRRRWYSPQPPSPLVPSPPPSPRHATPRASPRLATWARLTQRSSPARVQLGPRD